MSQHNDVNHRFKQALQQDTARAQKAEQHHASLPGLLMYGGTLGLLLVVPMIIGAYLGSWLDAQAETFGTRWTVSLIILGVVSGSWNVIWYLRARP